MLHNAETYIQSWNTFACFIKPQSSYALLDVQNSDVEFHTTNQMLHVVIVDDVMRRSRCGSLHSERIRIKMHDDE